MNLYATTIDVLLYRCVRLTDHPGHFNPAAATPTDDSQSSIHSSSGPVTFCWIFCNHVYKVQRDFIMKNTPSVLLLPCSSTYWRQPRSSSSSWKTNSHSGCRLDKAWRKEARKERVLYQIYVEIQPDDRGQSVCNYMKKAVQVLKGSVSFYPAGRNASPLTFWQNAPIVCSGNKKNHFSI